MSGSKAPWVIVGCGKSKRAYPTAAQNMYLGSYVRNAVKWGRSVTTSRRFLIFSAKHGLIPGTQKIEPYKASFASKGYAAEEGKEPPVSDAVVARQIAELGLTGQVIVLASPAYHDRLRAASKGDLQPVNPFRALVISQGNPPKTGWQAQQMIRWFGRIPPLPGKE